MSPLARLLVLAAAVSASNCVSELFPVCTSLL